MPPVVTWKKTVNGRVVLRERLDRVLGNNLAFEQFADGKVINLPCVHSDHHPILFDTDSIAPPPETLSLSSSLDYPWGF